LPICFTDNDFLWKLVVFNLFHEALESLEVTQNDVRVLPEAKYVLKKRCKKEHVQKVLSALEPLICLEATTEDAIILESLTQDPSINVGEARLIAKMLQTPCSIYRAIVSIINKNTSGASSNYFPNFKVSCVKRIRHTHITSSQHISVNRRCLVHLSTPAISALSRCRNHPLVNGC